MVGVASTTTPDAPDHGGAAGRAPATVGVRGDEEAAAATAWDAWEGTGMTEATYRVIPAGAGFKVEINRPGEVTAMAEGFASEADAQSWIEEDKRIAGINSRQEPIVPPHLREVKPC